MSFSGLFLTKDLEGCHFNSNNSSYCSNKKKKKRACANLYGTSACVLLSLHTNLGKKKH